MHQYYLIKFTVNGKEQIKVVQQDLIRTRFNKNGAPAKNQVIEFGRGRAKQHGIIINSGDNKDDLTSLIPSTSKNTEKLLLKDKNSMVKKGSVLKGNSDDIFVSDVEEEEDTQHEAEKLKPQKKTEKDNPKKNKPSEIKSVLERNNDDTEEEDSQFEVEKLKTQTKPGKDKLNKNDKKKTAKKKSVFERDIDDTEEEDSQYEVEKLKTQTKAGKDKLNKNDKKKTAKKKSVLERDIDDIEEEYSQYEVEKLKTQTKAGKDKLNKNDKKKTAKKKTVFERDIDDTEEEDAQYEMEKLKPQKKTVKAKPNKNDQNKVLKIGNEDGTSSDDAEQEPKKTTKRKAKYESDSDGCTSNSDVERVDINKILKYKKNKRGRKSKDVEPLIEGGRLLIPSIIKKNLKDDPDKSRTALASSVMKECYIACPEIGEYSARGINKKQDDDKIELPHTEEIIRFCRDVEGKKDVSTAKIVTAINLGIRERYAKWLDKSTKKSRRR